MSAAPDEPAPRRTDDELRSLRRLVARLSQGVIEVDRDLLIRSVNPSAVRLCRGARLGLGEPLPEPWAAFSLREYARRLCSGPPTRAAGLRVQAGGGGSGGISVWGLPPGGTDRAVLVIEERGGGRREAAEREFVTNAAHELRNPLTAITVSVEALKAGAKDDPEARERFLDHIDRECGRLARLTEALLTLARLDTGEQEPRLDVVELQPLLERVAARVTTRPGVALEVSCARDVVVVANSMLLEHALGNLVENAARYTREGRIEIVVASAGSGTLVVEVSDTGPGLPAGDTDRLFQRFVRGRGLPAGEGFGLGLAIANQTVRAVGGTLALESRPGAGTTARVTLRSGKLVTG